MRKLKSQLMSFILLLVVVVTLSGCQPILTPPVDDEYDERIEYLINLIEYYSFYYQEEGITKDMLYEGIFHGIVGAIGDPYSVYLDEESFAAFIEQMNAEFAGIGVNVMQLGEYTVILNVFPNSPAAKVGMQKGDIILEVDEKNVYGMSTAEISELIRGPEGTNRTITVVRESLTEPIIFNPTIELVHTPSVYYELLVEEGKRIGYIEVTNFVGDTFDQFKAAIIALQNANMTELIIDVRDNPGGYLHVVKDMMDYLIDSEEPLLYVRDRENDLTAEHQNNYNDEVETPIVVLINEYSASASEIFAASLNELRGVPLVGQTTYGKGTVQTTYYLNQAQTVAVKLTTANWLTPKKQWIQDIGVPPTYEVEDTFSTMMFLIDPELEIAYDTVNLQAISLQSFLYTIGYDIRTDGYIDQATMEALKSYQTKLINDGYAVSTLGQLDFLTIYCMNRDILALFDNKEYDSQLNFAIQELILKGNLTVNVNEEEN